MQNSRNVFTESGLRFTFAADWTVRKFDDHRFYRALSSAGLKGVDFVATHPDGRVVLMEVKNYRVRFRDQQPPIQSRFHGPEPPLAGLVSAKFQDSLRALRIIRRYYERRWWYRILIRWLPEPWWDSAATRDWAFFTTVERSLHRDPERVQFVLWLETEMSYRRWSAGRVKRIKSRLADLIGDDLDGWGHVVVLDSTTDQFAFLVQHIDVLPS